MKNGLTMTLRRRILRITGAMLLALVAALYGISLTVWRGEFVRLEEADAQEKVSRVLERFNDELTKMNDQTADWTGSDTAIPPSVAAYDRQAAMRYADKALRDLDVDLVLLVDQSRQVICSRVRDSVADTLAITPGDLLRSLLNKESPTLPSLFQQAKVGVLLMPQCELLVTTRPLPPEKQQKGSSRKTLIVARRIGDGFLAKLAKPVSVSLQMSRVDDLQLPDRLRAVRSSVTKGTSISFKPLNDTMIEGYAQIYDINGEPALIFTVTMPRTIYQQGERSLRYMIVSWVVVGLAFAAAMLWLLDNLVMRRLNRLAEDLTRITASGHHSESLPVSGNDELSVLTRNVNLMLQALRSAHDELETRVQDRTVELANANASLKQENLVRQHAELALRDSNANLERALDQLKKVQKDIVQQERLRALGQMASGITHDFNNVLSPILGYSELLLHRPEILQDKEKTAHYLQMINTALRDAGKVVNRLREFYRSHDDTGDHAPLDLNQVVAQVVELTKPRWKDQSMSHGINIQVLTAFQPLPPVNGNEAALREALINLILNAIDAMPHGGTISLRTRTKDGQAVVEVADTGTGMADEVRHRCFEPFFTTKGEHGTGLGLAMLHGIIQQHDGQVHVQSEVGQGTTFTIHLPVHSTANAEPAAPHVDVPVRTLNILLVDDEPTLPEILAEFLTADGHRVQTASSGKEGWEKFQDGSFDLVVLDRTMPHMTGDQLAAAIKNAAPDTRIIMLTGFGEVMKASREKPTGVDLILSKPVTIEDLRNGVATVMNLEDTATNEPPAPSAANLSR